MNRNRQLSLLAGLLSLQLYACKDRDFKEISNGDVRIQLTRLKGANQNDGSGFKFRLLPSRSFAAAHQLRTENFWYHMDSCFYTEKDGVKTYVAMVQPIANGVKDNFEYLLQFDPEMAAASDSVRLVYYDKYITRQHYTFNIQL